MYVAYYLVCILAMMYSSITILCSISKYKASRSHYLQICQQYSEIQNQSNIYKKWFKPESHEKYCISWIFYQYPDAKIHILERTEEEQFLLYKFSIVSIDMINLDLLHTPPFGRIKHLHTSFLNGAYEYEISWHMINVVNKDIVDCLAKMCLSLHAIIKGEKSYKLLINNQWKIIKKYPITIFLAGYPFELRINSIGKDNISLSVNRSDGSESVSKLFIDKEHYIDLIVV